MSEYKHIYVKQFGTVKWQVAHAKHGPYIINI